MSQAQQTQKGRTQAEAPGSLSSQLLRRANTPVGRIAVDGMLAAVYFALTFLVINTGSLKITFASLATLMAALLFGPLDAMAVAFVGEFLYQTILFGLTVTTPIWLVPPVLHALCLGLLAHPLTNRPRLCYAACLVCGLLNACFNTAALYFDSKIYHYYQPHLVFGMALARAGIAVATAAVLAAVALYLLKALRGHRA